MRLPLEVMESFMADSIFGFSYLPDEWGKDHDKAVESSVYAIRSLRDPDHKGAIETWAQFDDYVSLGIELRVTAMEIAKESDAELGAIWNTLKKRLLQGIDANGVDGNVIDGMFGISNHYKRKIRKLFAEAALLHPHNREAAKHEAWIMAQEESHKFVSAFVAHQSTQFSMFNADEYEQGEVIPLVDKIEDTTETGSDPQEVYTQQGFEDYLLDEAELTERQRKVAELILDPVDDVYKKDGSLNLTKVARMVGCSPQSVGRDLKVLGAVIEEWMIREREGGEGAEET